MYEMNQDQDTLPWYRQGWPWLLISLPASAVIGGIATIIIAVQSPNALVADDYYKAGLAINQQTQRLQTASQMGVSALVRASEDMLQLDLSGTAVGLADTLTLEFSHATLSDLDRSIQLTRVDGGLYQAAYPDLRTGNWYLRLHPEGQSWELRGRAYIDQGLQAYLGGIQAVR
jgi:hypothetical protein